MNYRKINYFIYNLNFSNLKQLTIDICTSKTYNNIFQHIEYKTISSIRSRAMCTKRLKIIFDYQEKVITPVEILRSSFIAEVIL